MRIALFEEDANQASALKSAIREICRKLQQKVRITQLDFDSVYDVDQYRDYDLVFFDLNGGISIQSYTDRIRHYDSTVPLLFLADNIQDAVVFDAGPSGCLIKPLTSEKLEALFNVLFEKNRSNFNSLISVRTESGIVKLAVHDIHYVEIKEHKLIYHCVDETYYSYGTLNKVEQSLSEYGFVRCNSCFLVNLEHVKQIEGYECTVGESKILISHPRRRKFVTSFKEHIKNRGH